MLTNEMYRQSSPPPPPPHPRGQCFAKARRVASVAACRIETAALIGQEQCEWRLLWLSVRLAAARLARWARANQRLHGNSCSYTSQSGARRRGGRGSSFIVASIRCKSSCDWLSEFKTLRNMVTTCHFAAAMHYCCRRAVTSRNKAA